ncbi:hypothetical protein EMGBS6_03450 [Opitutia bacterium]|nr:hypothetical protein EMGBS6_03450 [Opitutae bacterium]
MNSPLPLDPSLPEPLARREFLRMLAAAGAATLSMSAPRLLAESEKVVQPRRYGRFLHPHLARRRHGRPGDL